MSMQGYKLFVNPWTVTQMIRPMNDVNTAEVRSHFTPLDGHTQTSIGID